MENITNFLSTVFNIRPGEGRPTLLLMIHSFFIGIALVFLATASYDLFLQHWDVQILPWVYIASALVNWGFGFIYSYLEERTSFTKLLSLTLLSSLVLLCLFYGILIIENSSWTAMAFAICYNVLMVFIGLEFWGLASRMFNVRQGKRLFGLISSGEIVAGIIGGSSVPILVKWMGTANLILISISGLALSFVVLTYITRSFSFQLSQKEDPDFKEKDEPKPETKKGLFELLKNKYVLMVFWLNAFSVFGNYLIDYVFYEQANQKYPDEGQIASFLGIYFAAYRAVSLFCNVFLSGRLLIRYGLDIGLLVFPITLAAGTFFAVITYFFFGGIPLFFWIIIGIKIIDEVIRYSVEEPTIRILCQPLSSRQRLKTLALLETVDEPAASALMGLLLVLVTSFFSWEAIHLLSYFMFAILGAWIALALLVRREYTSVLTSALSKRKLDEVSLSLEDGSSIAVLHNGLTSSKAGEVIYCLNMLEAIEHKSLKKSLTDLLNHPEPQVRLHVLKKVASSGIPSFTEQLQKRLEVEKAPEVFGTLLKTLCAVGEAEVFDQVFPYLDDKDKEHKKGAMIGLLRSGGIDGVLGAGSFLNALLNSSKSSDRMLAAQVLGEVGISGFYRPLLKLLKDDDMHVRREAIIASGKLKNSRLFDLLIKNISVPAISNVAVAALINFGPPIIPDLEKAFNEKEQFRHVRIRIARILGKIGGEKAIEVLKKKFDYTEEDIRNHILSALVACNYQAVGKEVPLIQAWIENEVKDSTWTLSAFVDIGESQHTELLRRALEGEIQNNQERIFLLLSMIYSSITILHVKTNLAGNSPEKRAYALEILDNILSQHVKSMIFPLLDDITMEQRHYRLADLFPQEQMSRHQRIKAIIMRSHQWISSWTKACAVFIAGKIATAEFYDTIVLSLSDSSTIVRETAVWALGRLNPDDLVERLQPVMKDKAQRVADYARFVVNSIGFASIPMGTGYLTRSGKYTVELFANVLSDEGERRARRCRAANILSRFHQDTSARSALLNGLTIADKIVRGAALESLVKGKFTIEGRNGDELAKLLKIEIADVQRILTSILTFLQVKHSDRLVKALHTEIHHTRKRILSLLWLLSSHDTLFDPIFYWYIYQDATKAPPQIREQLLTLLTSVHSDYRTKVFALFEHQNPRQLIRIWEVQAGKQIKDIEENLKKIAFGSQIYSLSWSRICAMEMIVTLNLTRCVPDFIDALNDQDGVLRATAVWAIYKLDQDSYRQYSQKLKNDRNLLVSRTVRQLEKEAVPPILPS